MKEYLQYGRTYFTTATLSVALISLPFSIKICHGAIILFLLGWLTEAGWIEKVNIIRQSFIIQLVLAFLLLQLLGLLYTENLTAGWFSIEKKIFLFLLPIALATTKIRLKENFIWFLLNLFIISCVTGTLVCFFKAYQMMTMSAVSAHLHYLDGSEFNHIHTSSDRYWLPLSYLGLSSGIQIHPTYFSIYLLFCICLLLYQFKFRVTATFPKALMLLLIIYISIFIVFLSSRLAIGCLILLFLYACVTFLRHRFSWKSISLLLCTGLIIALALYSNPVTFYRSIEEWQLSSLQVEESNNYDKSIEIRSSLWWIAIHSLQHIHPLIGAGTGDVYDVMATTARQHKIANVLDTHDPHNEFLYILMSHGIVGLILLILTFWTLFYVARTHGHVIMLAFLILFIALCMTETALEIQKGVIFFALLFPILGFQMFNYQALAFSLRKIANRA
jgi:hypothetical protein